MLTNGVPPELDALMRRLGPLIDSPIASARGFGSTALKYKGKIFAMSHGGELVLKLPIETVAALIAAGEGAPFFASGRRPMREWVKLSSTANAHLMELAEVALALAKTRQDGASG